MTTETHNSALPLVTIGLPVYNGSGHLSIAIESLLKQDYPNIEFLISDNASTDDTAEICQRMTAGYKHVRYRRQAENIGPMGNYLSLLAEAKADYFMWASHDDKWNPQFVSCLVRRLNERPDAVLATSTILHMNEDGSLRNETPDRPSPGRSGLENLKSLYADHAASWVYGVYRTAWLREHVNEWPRYPVWGSDVMWLTDVCLCYPIVGDQDAILFKRLRRNSLAPKTARAVVHFWAYMLYFMATSGWRHGATKAEKFQAVRLAIGYVYRLGIRRSNPLRTVWRVLRMLLKAGGETVAIGVSRLYRRMIDKPTPNAAAAFSGNSQPAMERKAA